LRPLRLCGEKFFMDKRAADYSSLEKRATIRRQQTLPHASVTILYDLLQRCDSPEKMTGVACISG
jgi:hypothetical protein